MAEVDWNEPMDGEHALLADVPAQHARLSVFKKNHHQITGGPQLLSGTNITGNVEIHIHQAPKE